MENESYESDTASPVSTPPAAADRDASDRCSCPRPYPMASERRQRITPFCSVPRVPPTPRPATSRAEIRSAGGVYRLDSSGANAPQGTVTSLVGTPLDRQETAAWELPTLLAHPSTELSPGSHEAGPPVDPAPRMKVLVVDDHAATATLLKRALETMGYEAITAENGEEAWSLLGEGHVPLVISDWIMPGVDGLELCRRIRARVKPRYTYVVLVTSKGGDEDRLIGLDAGADDFLAKPVDIRELAARLKIARRILAMQEELERKNAALVELATTDSLTGLRNRRWFGEALESHVALSVRQGTPLSLVMLDVDDFKAFNDAFGHPTGDGVLWTVAQVLRQNTRAYDVVSRYGGEEFAVLLPATEAELALVLAERLRAAIEATAWPLRPVTASLGVSSLTGARPGSSDLVGEADQALYLSKRLGRNRVSRFEDLAWAQERIERRIKHD